jgi:hypothetical protein
MFTGLKGFEETIQQKTFRDFFPEFGSRLQRL